MAVVRITSDLKYSVRHVVGNQFDAAEEAAKKMRPEIGMDVYNIVLKDFLAETVQVDKAYFNTADSLEIRLRTDVRRDVSETWKLDADLPVPWSLPKSDTVTWETRGYHGIVNVTLSREPRFEAIFEQVDAWQNALEQVKEDRNAAQAEVERILSNFTTLAPALKAWPPLWDLLPESARDKHKEIVERRKPEAVAVVVDSPHLVNITSKLVTEKLLKGGR